MASAGRAASIDGVIVMPDQARVSVYDRGFLYGDAVFEVLRTYGGRPFALGEHLARLRGSAKRVAIDLPWSDAQLGRELADTLAAAGGDESYVRLMVTRGTGPISLDPDTARAPLRVVLVEPLAAPPREAYACGIAAVTVKAHRAVDGTTAVGAKVTNYLANLLALREAKARGGKEALIVDADGQIVEGATSNVFAVRGGTLVTPPEAAGILAGITRRHVLDAARSEGLVTHEATFSEGDLRAADEVFITSSIRELLPVVAIDAHPIGSASPGPITRRLHRAFRTHAGVGAGTMPWE
jgi:branched-chain amino acid aminotransferase